MVNCTIHRMELVSRDFSSLSPSAMDIRPIIKHRRLSDMCQYHASEYAFANHWRGWRTMRRRHWTTRDWARCSLPAVMWWRLSLVATCRERRKAQQGKNTTRNNEKEKEGMGGGLSLPKVLYIRFGWFNVRMTSCRTHFTMMRHYKSQVSSDKREM